MEVDSDIKIKDKGQGGVSALCCFRKKMTTILENINHFHLDAAENIIGFAIENSKQEADAKILTRASITSDEAEFYTYIEQVSNLFLNKMGIPINSVYVFLILIHKDLSADIYINEFRVMIDVCAKRDLKKGEPVRINDIADIRSLKFSDIKIVETDKIIFCFKVGWKFGLFFDLNRKELLDINAMYLDLGTLYRYLSFQDVYKVLEAKAQFEEMIKDGWFPFIELIGGEYKTLSEIYKNKFDFENRIIKLIGSFNMARIEKIKSKWWKKQIFKDKQQILQAGINALLNDNSEGYINCIKTLLTEIEGIIRFEYFNTTGKGKDVKIPELLKYIIEKGKTKSGSNYSLFLPLPFLSYLKDVVFARFDLETGDVGLSRHSSSHGVAKPDDYTKIKALQMILILDQIYFYI
ncbi:MAG: hypothetical protein HZA05_01775 [Nitrospirae bacterium]|nr:hypothetical protein [Nitrospirota bacterium]